jgi:hypothetical protein
VGRPVGLQLFFDVSRSADGMYQIACSGNALFVFYDWKNSLLSGNLKPYSA